MPISTSMVSVGKSADTRRGNTHTSWMRITSPHGVPSRSYSKFSTSRPFDHTASVRTRVPRISPTTALDLPSAAAK